MIERLIAQAMPQGGFRTWCMEILAALPNNY